MKIIFSLILFFTSISFSQIDGAYTVLLMHCDGAADGTVFKDEGAHQYKTYGDAVTSSSLGYVFGTRAGRFGDGAGGGYISFPNSADYDFGTGDFTIDFWIKRNQSQPDSSGVLSTWKVTAGTGWSIFYSAGADTNKLAFYAPTAPATYVLSSSKVTYGVFVHVAVVCSSGTVTMYFDGSSVGSGAGHAINSDALGLVVSRLYVDVAGAYCRGLLDEIRISKGIARWTGTFTPPTAAYAPTGDLITSYSETNQESDNGCYSTYHYSQSFTGDGKQLTYCKFYIKKQGTPTGLCYVKLYAHTGTYGSTGTPTGSVLATSAPLNIAELTTTYALTSFVFTTPHTLTNGTYYELKIEYSGASFGLIVGRDATSPTYGGNEARSSDSGTNWTADSGIDMPFYVYGTSVAASGNYQLIIISD